MLAFAWLTLGCLVGYRLLCLIPIAAYALELPPLALVLGLLVSSWLTWLAVLAFGYTAGMPIAAAIELALVLLLSRRRSWRRLSIAPPPRPLGRAFIALSLTGAAVLAYLLHTHMLEVKPDGLYSAGSTWGDLGLHLSLVSRFAAQSRFSFDLPILAGAKLTYPFLIDFLSACLHRMGLGLQAALSVPALLLGIAFLQLFLCLAVRLFARPAAGVLGVVIFVLNGSIAALPWFIRDLRASPLPWFRFLLAMDEQYANLPKAGLWFGNVVADMLLPQRAVLFGFPAFVAVAILLAANDSAGERRSLVAAGAIAGLLPFAHTHTFVVATGVLGWFALRETIRRRSLLHPWSAALLMAALLAAPQLAWQLSGGAHFGRFQWGWMKTPEESFALFWWRNWGVAAVLLPALLLVAARTPNRFCRHFYAALFGLFWIANLYRFQPWAYDNMKFLIYSYLGVALVTGGALAEWGARGWLGRVGAAVVLASLTAVGSLSLLRESYASFQFVSAADAELATHFRARIPGEARVLTASNHNHFVPTLTGRRIVLGYPGWLWTYGLPSERQARDVRQLFSGAPEAPALLGRYGISYVVIGPAEKRSFDVNTAFFLDRYPVVLRSPTVLVFKVDTGAL